MINHIEYGAANNGSRYNGINPMQYENLIKTLERLREPNNEGGIVYLNDFFPADLEFMLQKIRGNRKCGSTIEGIEFRLVPGNISRIEPPRTKTAHMKYIDIGFIHQENFIDILQRLARSSQGGLEFTHWRSTYSHIWNNLKRKFKMENIREGLYRYVQERDCGDSITMQLQPI